MDVGGGGGQGVGPSIPLVLLIGMEVTLVILARWSIGVQVLLHMHISGLLLSRVLEHG